MWLALEIIKNGLVQGVLIALLAISFNLVYRTTRVFHVALGAVLLASGYSAVYFERFTKAGIYMSSVVGLIVGVLVTFMLSILYSFLQKREASNSLRLIASLGAYFACAGTFALAFGADIKRSATQRYSSWMFGKVICTEADLRYLMTGFILIMGLSLIVWRTRLGWSMRALSSNRKLYLSLGKNEIRLLVVIYGIAGGIAGLCGAYEGLRNGVDPYGCLPFAITAAVAALLGARSLIVGPTAAGVGLGLIRSLTNQIMSDAWSDFVVYGLLLILLCINPTKLLGPAFEEERP